MASRMELYVAQFFNALFGVFSPQRLLFLVFGIYVTGCLLMRSRVNYFSARETGRTDALTYVPEYPGQQRTQKTSFQFIEAVMGRFSKGMLALKNENTTGSYKPVAIECIAVGDQRHRYQLPVV